MVDVNDRSLEADQRTAQASHDDLGGERGAVELLIGALAGSSLLPFVQAIATKAGEDVYAKIRNGLSRGERKRAEIEIRDAGTVTLVAPEARVVLQLPATMTFAMATLLDTVPLPRQRAGWLRVTWDVGTARWRVDESDEPPMDPRR